MLRVEFNRLINARAVLGATWPWVAQSDRRTTALRSTDPGSKVIRMKHPPPMKVMQIRSAIRHWRINWPRWPR